MTSILHHRLVDTPMNQASPSLLQDALEDPVENFGKFSIFSSIQTRKQLDEILTYMYVKPQVQWFPNEEDPPIDPFRIARGLRGYAHRARSRAHSGKDTWLSLT